MKVSVVVPVWNPGPNLGRCLDSLLAQTLDAADYEMVLVDDGSTDGTAARLDELAQQLGQRVQVLHIPNSGWPGRPRNIGVAVARGQYVQFLDNDDVLAPGALEALYDLAVGSDADIVLGKLTSDFRAVNRIVFRETVTRRTLDDYPVIDSLTPHKMFRRAFLTEHSIRFPEGRASQEDQRYVIQAYVKADSIAVLADQPCYFYLRRIGSGHNAGDVPLVPATYYAAEEHVLDTIDEAIPPGERRDRLHRRFYSVEFLGRLSGAPMVSYDDGYRRELAATVRDVVSRRFGPGVHAGAGASVRLLGCLLGNDDLPGLVALAGQYVRVTLRATTSPPRWRDGVLGLDVRAALYWGEDLLRCETAPAGWALPAALAPGVPEAERTVGDERDQPDADLALVHRANATSFGRPDGLRVYIADDGAIRVDGTVTIDPRIAMGGRPLLDGVWDVRLRLQFAGFSRSAALAAAGESAAGESAAGESAAPPEFPGPPMPGLTADGAAVAPYWTRPKPAIALDVGQWTRSLAAATAPTAQLVAVGRRGISCTLELACAPGARLPDAELLWQPVDGTSGGLLICPVRFVAEAGRAWATARGPRLPRHGDWRIWLRLGELGGPPAAALPWFVRRRGGRTSIVGAG